MSSCETSDTGVEKYSKLLMEGDVLQVFILKLLQNEIKLFKNMEVDTKFTTNTFQMTFH